MGFLREARDRRREMRLRLRAATAKAREDARHEAKLKKKAFRKGRKDERRRAKAEARETGRTARAQARLDARAMKRAEKIRRGREKDERKALKAKRRHQSKLAEKVLETQRTSGFTPDRAKSWAGAVRILLPVGVPLAYRGLTMLQNRNHAAEARRWGVSPEDVARHHGHGAALSARIEAVRESAKRLRGSGVAGAVGFSKDADDRLDVLAEAVRNAEHMTPNQRRRAHRSIGVELDGLDAEILGTLGVRS